MVRRFFWVLFQLKVVIDTLLYHLWVIKQKNSEFFGVLMIFVIEKYFFIA